MKTPDSDLRKLLQAIATTTGVKIYDRVPESAKGSYVHISDMSVSDNFTADQVIWDVELLLDVVTYFDNTAGGRKDADTISGLLLNQLIDKYQSMTDFKIAKSTVLSMNYVDEPSERGYIIRKLIRIAFIIESTT